MEKIEKLDKLLRHIDGVRDNCILLGKKFMQDGRELLGRQLIANGLKHDVSKLSAGEWDFLTGDNVDEKMLKQIVHQHNQTNPHHPEYWGTIHDMPFLYLSECICDWKARSTEFGTSLMDWIDGDAQKRFDFSKGDPVYKQIVEIVDQLCDKPFKQMKRKPKNAKSTLAV